MTGGAGLTFTLTGEFSLTKIKKTLLKLYRYEELTQSFAEKEQGRFQQIYLNLSKYEVKTSANLKHRKLFFYLAMDHYY